MDNKKISIGIGSLSVITLFIVLCLTIFSTLVLLSAHQDDQLTDKTIKSIQSFYKADGLANEKLMAIHQLSANTLEELQGALEQIEGITVQVNEQGAVMISYHESVSEQQILDVQLKASIDADGMIAYEKLGWALVPRDVIDYEIDEPEFEDVIIR